MSTRSEFCKDGFSRLKLCYNHNIFLYTYCAAFIWSSDASTKLNYCKIVLFCFCLLSALKWGVDFVQSCWRWRKELNNCTELSLCSCRKFPTELKHVILKDFWFFRNVIKRSPLGFIVWILLISCPPYSSPSN